MDIILFIFMVLVLLAEAFFFQGNMTALICGIVLCVVYVILRIVFAFVKKKAPKLIGRIICWAILFLLGISIFRLGIKGEGGGFILYAQDLDTVCEYLHDEDYEEAEELLEKMKEEYGDTDSLYMLSAIQYLSQGKQKEAWDAYYQISDKDSMVAIVIAEKIYELDESGNSTSNLYDLYCRAADRYPEWEYIQLCTGVIKIDLKQYSSALYYLYNAYAVNPENPQTLYFLGVASYKTGQTEDALYYFNASVENGADDTIKALIKGYLDEMDYWGEGAEAE